MRQATSTHRLAETSIGNCTSAQTRAMTSSAWRVWKRLATKPTTTAETADRKKNDEPTSCPKSRGESFSSSMIGLAASPTTILSAKLISMKRKISAVMPQAPFSGRLTGAGPLLSVD